MKKTDYVILGLLSEAPLTGYEIKQIIDIRFRFFWNESYGQLYPALKLLAQHGFIDELTMKIDPGTRRQQRRYQITEKGLGALQAWLLMPVEKETLRLEILLKMYFSNFTDPQTMIDHLMGFMSTHEGDLAMLNHFEQELKSLGPARDHDKHAHVLRVISFGQKVNEAYLSWSRETLAFFASRLGGKL